MRPSLSDKGLLLLLFLTAINSVSVRIHHTDERIGKLRFRFTLRCGQVFGGGSEGLGDGYCARVGGALDARFTQVV